MKHILTFLFVFTCFLAEGQNTPRVHTYTDTARPVGEIEGDYPYNLQLHNVEGDTLLSHDVFEKKGKPTVMLFWLTTCRPCLAELKAISEKYEGWKAETDFNLYAVSVDFPRNFKSFQKRVGESAWPFPAYHDVNREFPKIMPGSLNGLPQIFVLNGDGEIVHHKRRYMPGDEDKLYAKVKELAH